MSSLLRAAHQGRLWITLFLLLMLTDSMPTVRAGMILTHVVINEFEQNPPGDETYTGGEFVELFNPTLNPVLIGGWVIETTHGDISTYVIPSGTILPSGGFWVVTFPSQFIDNAGDSLVLRDSLSTVVDATSSMADTASDNYDWQRIPDAGDQWEFRPITKGTRNSLEVVISATTTLVTTASTATSSVSTRFLTSVFSTTTNITGATSTTFQTTTSTHYEGSVSTTYTTRKTLYSTSPMSVSTTTVVSTWTSTSTTTQTSKTGSITTTQTSTSIATSGSTVYVRFLIQQTLVERFLERVVSSITNWFYQLVRIMQSALTTETVRDTVVRVEPELYPRGTTRILLDASPKPGTINTPVTFSGTLLGSWRPIKDGVVVNRPVEITTDWGFSTTLVTDNNGRFTIQTTCPSKGGNRAITATFYEDQDLQGNSTTISYQILEYVETTLSLSHRFESSGMGGARRFYGYLREKNTGNPVPNKTVRLTIYSGGYGYIFDVTTNSQGYYDYLFTTNSGIFTWAEARFAGSGLYLASFSGRIYP